MELNNRNGANKGSMRPNVTLEEVLPLLCITYRTD
jgi:hypothetical protein